MISLWDFLCEHKSVHLLRKTTLVQALADAGVTVSGMWGASQGPFSLPFSLPLAIPAKSQPGNGSPCLSPR